MEEDIRKQGILYLQQQQTFGKVRLATTTHAKNTANDRANFSIVCAVSVCAEVEAHVERVVSRKHMFHLQT